MLLEDAKSQLAGRHDIQALEAFEDVDHLSRDVFRDAIKRLHSALALRPPPAIVGFLTEMVAPLDKGSAIGRDIRAPRGSHSSTREDNSLTLRRDCRSVTFGTTS